MNTAAFEGISARLKARSGLMLGPDKLYLLETRLAPIMKREGLRDLGALEDAMRRGVPGLEAEVVEAMTTNETLFFRDENPFTHLRQITLPRLHEARSPGTRLRIWSAAASTGQEAYSIAITLAEMPPGLGGRPAEIIGTDISREALARARAGLYTQFEVQRGLSIQRLMKYFRKEADGWRVSEALRAMTEFRELNLLGDLRSLGTFDVVFCRNVLIYFDAPTKTRVLEAIARQMAPDGVLYLGGAETVLGLTSALMPVPGERGVYARAEGVEAMRRAG
ncbi:MAG TPA: protein-glutamate O-methyltransferase CheR [Acetobacteraceae bacterium]|nr:protein-glutamate O-methyltransferase CheR [Acetobacteraceae bacterium]